MTSSKPHIILIGMPACGKSTVGVLAAKALGYRFIDSDLVIQERDGRRLHRIIAEEGQAGFLAIEEAVNLTLGNDSTSAGVPAVIATGGSVVYCDAAMVHLKTLGKTVYLKIPFDEMCRRLGDYSHRGVIMRHGNSLEDMYAERAPLYEKYADLTVEVSNAQLSDSLDAICEKLY